MATGRQEGVTWEVWQAPTTGGLVCHTFELDPPAITGFDNLGPSELDRIGITIELAAGQVIPVDVEPGSQVFILFIPDPLDVVELRAQAPGASVACTLDPAADACNTTHRRCSVARRR